MIDRAGVDISVPQAYGLFRLCNSGPIQEEVAAKRLGLPLTQIRPKIDEMVANGRAQRAADGTLALTPQGSAVIDQLCEARREILEDQLDGWSPEQHADLLKMLRLLADNSLDAPDRSVMAR